MQLKTKSGLALAALGIAILGAWNLWTKSRRLVPVDLPLSLTAAQPITSNFKLNFDGLYLIEIEAQKTMPLETLHCLMGVEADPARCKDAPPAITATWILSRNGQEYRRGTSAEPHSATAQTDGVARVIGEFQGKAGEAYQLQVTLTADASALATAHPRLKVTVASIAYTDLQSADVLAFSTAFICVLFGATLLAIALYAYRRRSSDAYHNTK
ncbi:MAG: hypothetical protein WBL50_27235 [Candidatus Acidiferrum sp.]